MFKRNRAATEQLQRDPAYRRLLRDTAGRVVRHAIMIAPDGGPHRGYRETLRVGEQDGTVTAESTDPFAHIVEFGSINNPAYAPLRRAVRGEGLDLRDD